MCIYIYMYLSATVQKRFGHDTFILAGKVSIEYVVPTLPTPNFQKLSHAHACQTTTEARARDSLNCLLGLLERAMMHAHTYAVHMAT